MAEAGRQIERRERESVRERGKEGGGRECDFLSGLIFLWHDHCSYMFGNGSGQCVAQSVALLVSLCI